MKKMTTEDVWKRFECLFDLYGFPTEIRTDGGPQFRAKLGEKCHSNGIRHVTSSPYFPSSNGLAEAAVRSVKSMLKKVGTKGISAAMRQFRATPRAEGPAPAEMFYGRPFRNSVPRIIKPVDFDPEAKLARTLERDAKAENVPRKELTKLKDGCKVRIQHPSSKRWDETGKVLRQRTNGRSYVIQTENGKEIRRNRRFLRPLEPILERPAVTDTPQETEEAIESQVRRVYTVHHGEPEQLTAAEAQEREAKRLREVRITVAKPARPLSTIVLSSKSIIRKVAAATLLWIQRPDLRPPPKKKYIFTLDELIKNGIKRIEATYGRG